MTDKSKLSRDDVINVLAVAKILEHRQIVREEEANGYFISQQPWPLKYRDSIIWRYIMSLCTIGLIHLVFTQEITPSVHLLGGAILAFIPFFGSTWFTAIWVAVFFITAPIPAVDEHDIVNAQILRGVAEATARQQSN